MSDTTHPLLEILHLSNLNMFKHHTNFELFTTLKGALEKDGMSSNSDEAVDAMFPQAVLGTDDLLRNEGSVLRAIIEGWALGVLTPLLEQLNAYNENSEDLTISMEGYLHDATLCFDGDIEEYVEDLDPSILSDFKEVCTEWEHTLNVIVNSSDLLAAVNEALAKRL